MEDSDDESYVKHVDTDEQDSDYEFDAPQFFDFTRPEFGSEIEEAERWFEVSGDYPHSREFFFFLFVYLLVHFFFGSLKHDLATLLPAADLFLSVF